MHTCEGCGNTYENTFKFCPNCGRPSPETDKNSNIAFQRQSELACPKCRKDDNVAKVSAILQRDIHSIQSQMPITSVRTDDYGKINSDTSWQSVSSTQVSNLAQTLLPPPAPVTNGCGLLLSLSTAFFTVMVVFFGAIMGIGSMLSNTQTNGAGSGMAVFCIGVPTAAVMLGMVYYYVTKDLKYKKDYPSHRQLWENAMLRHNQLYYCFRDDCIFIPGENTYTSPSNLYEYIKWHPYSSKPPFRIFQF